MTKQQKKTQIIKPNRAEATWGKSQRKKTQNAKRAEVLQTIVYAYLILLFAGLPLYMRDKLVQIGNAKYLFFRNTTIALGGVFLLALLWQWIRGGCRRPEIRKKLTAVDLAMLAYLLVNVIAYLGSPCRWYGFWGYPGWYLGLATQMLFVGIYFAVSRYYDGSRSIWWIAGIAAAVVELIGWLNRLDIDVLGAFRGMENGDWNRTQLLSTIGNNNWYAGYISVTAGIAIAAAFYGRKYVRVLGMAGAFLYYATAVTSNSTTALLAACGISGVLLLLSLRERRRFLRALEIVLLLPAADFVTRLSVTLHLTGLVLAGETEERLFFSPVWYVVFAIGVAAYLILRLRERQGKRDLLADGRVFRMARWFVVGAVALGCIGGLGYLVRTAVRIQSGAGTAVSADTASGRLALWLVTLISYGKEPFGWQLFGMGPDSYYYALYQWGSDAMDWTNRGLLANQLYANAHNEWLTILIQQGLVGTITYAAIFGSALRTLWKAGAHLDITLHTTHSTATNSAATATADPVSLAIALGLCGYLICSLFTFQHVLSTPFVFALLGMARGVSLIKSYGLRYVD